MIYFDKVGVDQGNAVAFLFCLMCVDGTPHLGKEKMQVQLMWKTSIITCTVNWIPGFS